MQSNNYTESNESNEVNTDNENTNTNSGAPQFSMPSASFGAPPPTNTLPAVFRFAPTTATATATATTAASATAAGIPFAGMSFGAKPNATVPSATVPSASMASVPGGFGFGPAQHTQHTQRTSTGGCCNPFPFGNHQRHPETGQTMPQQTSVFGFRTDKTSNTPRDKLIDELYSELRNLREHVDTSNKIIGNMYELLRKI